MGGASADYGQSSGQAGADPMSSMTANQQPAATQGNMFGKMDAWNVESSHPEQIAQGFAKGIESGASLGMMANKKSSAKGDGAKSAASGKQGGFRGVDEYGYPYTLDANGNPVYEDGSRQIS